MGVRAPASVGCLVLAMALLPLAQECSVTRNADGTRFLADDGPSGTLIAQMDTAYFPSFFEESGSKFTQCVFMPVVQKLLCIPANYDAIVIVDPTTGVIDNTTVSGAVFNSTNAQFFFGTYVDVIQKVIMAPFHFGAVVLFDPLHNTTDVTSFPVPSRSGEFNGAAFAPTTNEVFLIPFNGVDVMSINVLTNVTSTFGNFINNGGLYAGATYCPSNDKIYACPSNAEAVLIVDPRHHTTDNSTIRVGSGRFKFNGIAYSPIDGLLFLSPSSFVAVLLVNPLTNTTDMIPLLGFNNLALVGKFGGITFSTIAQKMFLSPQYGDVVAVVDPRTKTLDLIGNFTQKSPKFGMFEEVLKNGTLVLIAPPSNAANFLAVSFCLKESPSETQFPQVAVIVAVVVSAALIITAIVVGVRWHREAVLGSGGYMAPSGQQPEGSTSEEDYTKVE